MEMKFEAETSRGYVRTSGVADLDPREKSLFRQAVAATHAGRRDEAEEAYRAWAALAPRDPRPAYGLALLLLARGEYTEGWRLYEARCYIRETGITKPEGLERPELLPLPPEAVDSDWARQEIDVADLPPALRKSLGL